MRIFHSIYHSGFTILPFPQEYAGAKVSLWPSIIALFCFLKNYNHHNKYEVIFHCGSDLHFTDDEWHLTFSHLSVGSFFIGGLKKGLWTNANKNLKKFPKEKTNKKTISWEQSLLIIKIPYHLGFNSCVLLWVYTKEILTQSTVIP